MTHKPEDAAIEEIILPENLVALGSVLEEGVTPLDVSMVLAKVFRVQHAEVALLRLEGGLLRFILPEHLRTTGAIPISSKAVAAHTALSKKAEIFNNFARVKHASIFETIRPLGTDAEDASAPDAHPETDVGADSGSACHRSGRHSNLTQRAGSALYPGLQPRRPARPGTRGRRAGGVARDAIELKKACQGQVQLVETQEAARACKKVGVEELAEIADRTDAAHLSDFMSAVPRLVISKFLPRATGRSTLRAGNS